MRRSRKNSDRLQKGTKETKAEKAFVGIERLTKGSPCGDSNGVGDRNVLLKEPDAIGPCSVSKRPRQKSNGRGHAEARGTRRSPPETILFPSPRLRASACTCLPSVEFCRTLLSQG